MDYCFSIDCKKVEIDILINKKDVGLVKKNSCFWNISGVNVKVGILGVDFLMDSLVFVVMGGVVFDFLDNDEFVE